MRRENRTDYWLASLVAGVVILGAPIISQLAIGVVRAGGSIFARNRSKAMKLARAAFGLKGYRENHGNSSTGYWPHYHVTRHITPSHIWYFS